MFYQKIPGQLASESQYLQRSSTEEGSYENDTDIVQYRKGRHYSWQWLPFLLSAVLNLVLVYFLVLSRSNNQCASRYAGLLPAELTVPWRWSTEFSSDDILESSKRWDTISFDAGVVALDDDFVKRKSLPASARFAWDASKSVYLVNAFHCLHCTKTIHTSLMEFKLGKPRTYPFDHNIHCLDIWRQEIICNADDTPLYHSPTDKGFVGIGDGQQRQCKDWSKLESWADEYNACYRYHNHTVNTMDDQLAARFSFCPPGSPYKAKVEEYLKSKELI